MVRSFAELCVLNGQVRLLRSVDDAGAPLALIHLGLDRAGWLDYLGRIRVPDSERLPDEGEFIERSLFLVATNLTVPDSSTDPESVFTAVTASSIPAALQLAFECQPGHPGIEMARHRNSEAGAFITRAEMTTAEASDILASVAGAERLHWARNV